MTDTEDETRLVLACREGDGTAFAALVSRYERAIYHAAYRLVGNADDARDVTQSVFLKAYEHLGSFDTGGRFYSWIYRIAVNESINALERRGRTEPLRDDRESDSRGPDEMLAGAELSRQVQETLMTLKPEHRTVVVLRHFSGLSYEEIGQILGLPEKTVKSRLFSARQLLKDHLTKRGILG